jgi:hypothetical protein
VDSSKVDVQKSKVRRPTTTGTVIDAATSQPVRGYSYVLRPAARAQTTQWQQHTLKHIKDAAPFTIDARRTWDVTEVRVWCDGFRPATAQVKRGQDAELTFKLERDRGVSGRVVTPDGAPADGATVALATVTTEPAIVANAQLRLSGSASAVGAAPTLTADDGSFTLPSEIRSRARRSGPHQRLGRGGTARVGQAARAAPVGAPPRPTLARRQARRRGVGGVGVALEPNRATAVSRRSPACGWNWKPMPTGDSPPIRLSRRSCTSVRWCASARAKAVASSASGRRWNYASRPNHHDHAGRRRPAGRWGDSLPADGHAGTDWSKHPFRVFIRAPHIGFPGDDVQWKAQGRFFQAAGSGRYHRDITPDADGHFRIEALPQGDYQISGIYLTGSRGGFEMPPMDGGKSDDPLDLGELRVGNPPRQRSSRGLDGRRYCLLRAGTAVSLDVAPPPPRASPARSPSPASPASPA